MRFSVLGHAVHRWRDMQPGDRCVSRGRAGRGRFIVVIIVGGGKRFGEFNGRVVIRRVGLGGVIRRSQHVPTAPIGNQAAGASVVEAITVFACAGGKWRAADWYVSGVAGVGLSVLRGDGVRRP